MPKTAKGGATPEQTSHSLPDDPLPTFEDAMSELERIVAQMESSDLSLEDSLKMHKRGLDLARFCQETLANAQQQVRILEEGMLKVMDEDADGR